MTNEDKKIIIKWMGWRWMYFKDIIIPHYEKNDKIYYLDNFNLDLPKCPDSAWQEIWTRIDELDLCNKFITKMKVTYGNHLLTHIDTWLILTAPLSFRTEALLKLIKDERLI